MPTIIEDEVLYFTGESFTAVTNTIEMAAFALPEDPLGYIEPEAEFDIVDFNDEVVVGPVAGSRVEDLPMFSAILILPDIRGQYRWRATVTQGEAVYRQTEKIYVYGY